MKTYYQLKLKSLISAAIIFLPYFTKAQTTFEKIYPATNNQDGIDAVPAIDGGYIIVGSTETKIANDLDIMIVKTDDNGDTVWIKKYGGTKPEYPNNILKTSDGYFVIGYTQSFGSGDYNQYLLKIKVNGDTAFTRVYGGYGNEDGKEIVATADGNYLIAGESNSLNYSDNQAEMIKIDPLGNVLWTKYYGGSTYESARSVKLCPDKGFILAGKTAAAATGFSSVYLVRTDSAGTVEWTKTISNANSYEGKYVLANSDGSYTLAVDDSSQVRDSDVRIMKLSADGNTIEWNNMFGGNDKDIVKMIQPTTDGGYIVAAISRSFGWINPDMWIIKLDAAGDSTWWRHFGGSGHEHCYSARQCSDGGYIAVGHSKSYTPNTEVMFVKMDQNGDLLPASVNELALNRIFNVYPNPSDGVINMDFLVANASGSKLSVSNALGQTIFSENIETYNQSGSKTIDLRGKEPGIYFLTMQTNGNISTKKIMLKIISPTF